MSASDTTAAALLKVMVQRMGAEERLCDVALEMHRSSGHSPSRLMSASRRGRLGTPHLHGNSIPTAEEKEARVYTAEASSYAVAALSRTDLASLLKSLCGEEVGQTWAHDFVSRHKKELSARNCKVLADK